MCIRDRSVTRGPVLNQTSCSVLLWEKKLKTKRERRNAYKPPENIVNHECNDLSLIHISEPTRRVVISYAVFCLKKKRGNYLGQHSRRLESGTFPFHRRTHFSYREEKLSTSFSPNAQTKKNPYIIVSVVLWTVLSLSSLIRNWRNTVRHWIISHLLGVRYQFSGLSLHSSFTLFSGGL